MDKTTQQQPTLMEKRTTTISPLKTMGKTHPDRGGNQTQQTLRMEMDSYTQNHKTGKVATHNNIQK